MRIFKAILLTIFNLILAAGALACVLVWFEIKPGDLRLGASLPHLVWLVSAIVLLVLAVTSSAYALYRTITMPEKTIGTQTDWREAFRSPHWEIINKRTFQNEIVDLDGRSFRDCTFVNAKFMYRGDAPTEIVGTAVIEGSVIMTTDNPAIDLYTRLYQFITSAPNAEIHDGIGVPYRKKLLHGPDNGLTESDPRIYLIDIKDNTDAFFSESPFVLANMGGGVAHRIQVQTMTFGYTKIVFPVIDSLSKDKQAEAMPVVESAQTNEHSLLPVLQEAWNATGMKDGGKDFLEFPFEVRIRCETFDGSRKIETTVDLTYSYIQQKWKRERRGPSPDSHKIFQVKQTRFNLIS